MLPISRYGLLFSEHAAVTLGFVCVIICFIRIWPVERRKNELENILTWRTFLVVSHQSYASRKISFRVASLHHRPLQGISWLGRARKPGGSRHVVELAHGGFVVGGTKQRRHRRHSKAQQAQQHTHSNLPTTQQKQPRSRPLLIDSACPCNMTATRGSGCVSAVQ